MPKINKKEEKTKEAQFRVLEELKKEYRIDFINNSTEKDWPTSHREIFRDLQACGKTQYDEYGTNNGEELELWEVANKLLAKKVASKAEECFGQNEPTWRFSCENLVFSRLDAELACKRCQRRVWRSAIEVPIDSSIRGAEKLKQRQQNRKSCLCPPITRSEDIDRDEVVGFKPLFIDRADDAVIHSPELAEKLPKKSEHPDRVFGLRQNRALENALYANNPDGKQVRELIEWSPYYDNNRPILFPFLVVEAKSAKAGCSWHEIKLQTTFPIFTFLQVQNNLRLATGATSKLHVEPLVWFFMNKGEEWCVCAAFQSEGHMKQTSPISHDTKIIELWQGKISNRDDALRLILIVDLICDWARDIYRLAISYELRVLSSPAGSDVRTVITETDIFSSGEVFLNQDDDESPEQNPTEDSDTAAFFAHDSPHGVMRHAVIIESKFSGLFVTGENIKTLVGLLPAETVDGVCRKIMAHMKERSLILFPRDLDRIENYWTGNDRRTAPHEIYETEFYAVITYTSYMTSSWEQVRELSVLAIAKDAFTYLVENYDNDWQRRGSSYIRGASQATFSYPQCSRLSGDLIMGTVSHLKDGSIYQNLFAAISRIAYRINNEAPTYPTDRLDLCIDDGHTWNWVQRIYKQLKSKSVGKPIPSCLRISKRQDAQVIDPLCKEPFDLPSNFHVSPQGAILVYGQGPPLWPSRKEVSPLCIYFVRESLDVPDERTLGNIILEAFQNYDVYHTTRDNRVQSIAKRAANRLSWNIENTYGVHFSYGNESFPKWLQALGHVLPTRQGSPRGPSDSGSFLTRNYYPWRDSGLKISEHQAQQRHEFIQELIEKECKAWRSIAQTRYNNGVICCACCAVALDGSETENHVCRCCANAKNASGKYSLVIWNELQKALAMRKSLDSTTATLEEGPIEYNIGTPPLPPEVTFRPIKPLALY